MSYKKAEMPVPSSLSDLKTLEGYYLGSETIQIEGQERKSLIHTFRKLGNVNSVVEVWGFNMLDRILKTILPGVLVKIKYLGKKEEAGKSSHECEVFYDSDRTLNINYTGVTQ